MTTKNNVKWGHLCPGTTVICIDEYLGLKAYTLISTYCDNTTRHMLYMSDHGMIKRSYSEKDVFGNNGPVIDTKRYSIIHGETDND